jgi:hypothetical protein
VYLRSQWEQPSCHRRRRRHHHDAGLERTHPALEIRHVLLDQEDQIHLDLVPWARLGRHERLQELLAVLLEVVQEQ